jgi:DNA-binding response OmpR family regulator
VERHRVLLVRQLEPGDARSLTIADVVAIDCRDVGALGTRDLVDSLRQAITGAIVVLDGGLSRDDIARLFRAGAQDYFSEPFNVPVIAERLEHLAESQGDRFVEDRR